MIEMSIKHVAVESRPKPAICSHGNKRIAAEDIRKYLNPKEINNLVKGETLDILYEDGHHYQVIAKELGEAGLVNFGYSTHNYTGPLNAVYLAKRGVFHYNNNGRSSSSSSNDNNINSPEHQQ